MQALSSVSVKSRARFFQHGTFATLLLTLLIIPGLAQDISALQKRAENGDSSAQFELGRAYASGSAVVLDKNKAIELYRSAAAQGHAEAQSALGFMLAIVPETEKEAIMWFRKAAEQGLAKAQFNFGFMLSQGRGTEKNLPQAAEWYEKAANQGMPEAQFRLGMLHYRGEGGIDRNYTKALDWLNKAAAQGLPGAINTLAVMHETGLGMPVDSAQAVVLFRQAAEKGYPMAQANLGRVLALGQGTDRDPIAAYAWTRLSADQGELMGVKELEELLPTLQPDQIKQGESVAKALRQRLAKSPAKNPE